MSDFLGTSVKIYGQEFRNYEHLAQHMKSIVTEYMKKTGVVKNKQLIGSLKDFKKSLVKGANSGVYDFLFKEDFPKLCVDLMKLCVDQIDKALLTALLSCIITVTDNSLEMCERLLDNGLIDLIVNQTIELCEKNFKGTVKDLYDQLILIIHNVASHPQFQGNFLRCKDISVLKDKICYCMESKDPRTRILTMAVLTWLIEKDEDKSKLEFYINIIDNFVDYINRGLRDKDLRCEGLTVSEMLLVLVSLSNIESIKQKMIHKTKLTTLIMDIFKSGKPMKEEKEKSLALLHNLCFGDVTRVKDKTETVALEKVLSLVPSFIDSSEPKMKEHAENILSDVEEVQEDKLTVISNDIFISCTKVDEKLMVQIEESLTGDFMRVWRIKEPRVISEVKCSIEKSKMVLIGVSNLYFNDQFCRSECQHAQVCRKPIIYIVTEPQYEPRGWLENIIQDKDRIDFLDENEFGAVLQKLINKYESKFGTVKPKKAPQLSPTKHTSSKDYTFIKSKQIKLWSQEEVSIWLKHKDLPDIVETNKNFNGEMINYLADMKINDPKSYSQRLNEFGLELKDEINLDKAIQALKN